MLLLAALLSLGAPGLIGPGLPAGPADEIDRHLAALGDPSVHVRHGAERWLSANVDATHVARLTPLITGGDAEVRRRISRIVAQADADLTIVAALFAQAAANRGQARLAAVARQALVERINRWSSSLSMRAETDAGLSQILTELAAEHGPRALRLSLEQPLAEVCALLERTGALPIGITVEAEIRGRELRRPDEALIRGGWNELVPRLASAYGVSVELHGFERTDEGARRRGFLRFTSRPLAGRRPGTETGEDVLVRWFGQSTTAVSAVNRIAAAKNLAACGWPDALSWLEARYRASGDEAALGGLLHAAATGRSVPLLFEGEVLRLLVRDLDQDLDAGDAERLARAKRTLDALGKLGCLGRQAEDLGRIVLLGWEDAGPRARWGRLVILEGMRCPSAGAALDALVMDPALAPTLRIQALRAWSAATASSSAGFPPRELPGGAALLGSITGGVAESAVELGRMLAAATLRPPAAWQSPEKLPAQWGFLARVAFFGWVLSGSGSRETAPEMTGRLGLDLLARAPGEDAQERGEALAEVFSIWVEGGSGLRLARAWNGARGAAGDTLRLEIDRVALLARLISPEDGMEVYRALRAKPVAGGADLAVLALAASWTAPEGEFARQRLTVLFQEALSQNRDPAEAAELIEAVEGALMGLQRLGMDDVARDWRRPTLRGLIRRHGDSDLARGLSGDWPRYPVRRALDPAGQERRLPRGL